MNNPFDFFEDMYCVSLPESVNRWTSVTQEFRKVGIADRVTKISARKPNPEAFCDYLHNDYNPLHKYSTKAMVGCSLGHLKALTRVMQGNASNVLVFEDDITFDDNVFEKLQIAIDELPSSWCVFYLGGCPADPAVRYSNNLLSVGRFWGAYAYALNRKCIPRVCDIVIDNLSTTSYDLHISNPKFTSDHFERYCMYTPICKNAPGWSIIEERWVDWTEELEKDWEKNVPK